MRHMLQQVAGAASNITGSERADGIADPHDTEQRADSEHEQRGDSKVVALTSQGDLDISNAVPQNAQSAAAGTDGTALRKAKRKLAE